MLKLLKTLGLGGGIGNTSDYRLRSLKFDSHWIAGLFLLSFLSLSQWCVLNQVPRGDATPLVFKTFQGKNGGLAVQLEAMQA